MDMEMDYLDDISTTLEENNPLIESDNIHKFLQNKLREIKLRNQKLSEIARKRQETLENLRKGEFRSVEKGNVEVVEVWKKICYEYYVMGAIFKAENASNDTNFNVILKWNHRIPISYKVYNANQLWKTNYDTNVIEIVIVIEVPISEFIEQSSVSIDGVFSTTTTENKKLLLQLPKVEINPQKDLQNRTDLVETHSVCHGKNTANLLACLCSFDIKKGFLLFAKDDYNLKKLSNFIEIDCGLTRIDAFKNEKPSSFYVSNCVNPVFDGSLIETETFPGRNYYHLFIYCRVDLAYKFLLKHIQHNLKDRFLVVPAPREANLVETNLDASVENFKRCIQNEVGSVKKILNYFSHAIFQQQIDKLKSELIVAEYNSDLVSQLIGDCFKCDSDN